MPGSPSKHFKKKKRPAQITVAPPNRYTQLAFFSYRLIIPLSETKSEPQTSTQRAIVKPQFGPIVILGTP